MAQRSNPGCTHIHDVWKFQAATNQVGCGLGKRLPWTTCGDPIMASPRWTFRNQDLNFLRILRKSWRRYMENGNLCEYHCKRYLVYISSGSMISSKSLVKRRHSLIAGWWFGAWFYFPICIGNSLLATHKLRFFFSVVG